MELTPLLKIMPFRGMSETELASLLFGGYGSVRRFATGDFIALQGSLCRGLYVLVSGRVRAAMVNADGKEVTIEEIEAPALLASAFVFATENRFPVQISAIKPCEVCVVGKERLTEAMSRIPSLMAGFLTDISDRSAFLGRKLNEFALLDLKKRILEYLKTNPVIRNQREVAQRLGVTRPSLARALSELAKEGRLPASKGASE